MTNTAYKVRGEWLVDSNDDIVFKPLRFWLDHFGVTPFALDKGYVCTYKRSDGRFIDIQVENGFMMNWYDRDQYLDRLFFVGNADLDRVKLRLVISA